MATTATRPTEHHRAANHRPAKRVTVHRRVKSQSATSRTGVATLTIHAPAARSVVHTATPEEAAELFDNDAQRELGISGREFLDRWESGYYTGASDWDQHGRAVLRLAWLIRTIQPQDLPA